MRRLRVGATVGTVVTVLAVCTMGVAVAAGHSYGQPSDGAGPGLENRWGPGPDAGASLTAGYSYGESSEGAGPGLENKWGPTSGAGKQVSPSVASGDQNQNQYRKRYQSEYGQLVLDGDCTGNQDRTRQGKHWI